MTNGMDLPDSDWGDFSCRRAVDSSSCTGSCFGLVLQIRSSKICGDTVVAYLQSLCVSNKMTSRILMRNRNHISNTNYTRE